MNASRKPGEWSSYDIVLRLPKCNERKQQLEPGFVTVHLNGVLVQERSELRFRPGMCDAAPLMLQDHSGFPGLRIPR